MDNQRRAHPTTGVPSDFDTNLARYQTDPFWRAVLDYCVPLGIPVTTFLTWPVEAQAAALAWRAAQGDRCPGCGTFGFEWEHNPNAYQAIRTYCSGCKRRDTEHKALTHAHSDTGGWSVALARTTPKETPDGEEHDHDPTDRG